MYNKNLKRVFFFLPFFGTTMKKNIYLGYFLSDQNKLCEFVSVGLTDWGLFFIVMNI